MPSEFDTDTAVARAGDDRFTTLITDRWNTPIGPNGGYLLAIVTRALAETVPMPDPLTVGAHFLRPANPGNAEIATEVIKTGRRHATARARMTQDGKEIMEVVGTFADLEQATGRTLVLNEPPALPPPDEAIDAAAGMDMSAFPSLLQRLQTRVGEVPGFLRGAPSNEPTYEAWMRFADGRAPDPLSLVAFPDFMAPTVFEIGEYISSTVEMTVHARAVPAPGWLAMRVRARHVIGGYHEEDAELWDSSGGLVAQSRQLALLGG